MTPRNPTNADIFRKLDSMDVRVSKLETWKVAEDAARSAVKEYRDSETKARMDKAKYRESRAWIEVLKQASIVLAILGAILYAYYQGLK
jgi:hypothetical protein